MIKIICNGEELELAPDSTVAELLTGLGLKAASVVVECDGRILRPEEYEGYRLRNGVRLELIRFVGGG